MTRSPALCYSRLIASLSRHVQNTGRLNRWLPLWVFRNAQSYQCWHFYQLPTRLQEGNVFNRACLSFCLSTRGNIGPHCTGYPSPPLTPDWTSDLGPLLVTSGGHNSRPPQSQFNSTLKFFSSEVVQKCQICQLCVFRKNPIVTSRSSASVVSSHTSLKYILLY